MERNADMPGRGQGKKLPKIFVLDTNIILHDYKAIHHFQENDIVIPITVLEELDKFKKGHDTLSFNAREFMREIDRLTDRKKLGRNGVPIAKHLGNLMIELSHPFPDELKGCFQDDIPDHRILATAIWVKAEHPDRFVALVTKDVNLRMKAKAVGMEAQDYLTDRIEESRLEYTRNEVEVKADVPAEKLQALAYGAQGSIPFGEILDKEPLPNQLFQFKWDKDGSETVCARYDARGRKIVLVKKKYAYGISPRNDEQKFALDACLNPDIKLVSLTGGAGTGKTLLALAAALEQEHDFDQIILSRPAVILGNQDIGFLPGDQKSKMAHLPSRIHQGQEPR